jgi:hypothetical protein
MNTTLEQYLKTVKESLNLDTSTEDEVIKELEGDITDRLEEFKEKGTSEDEAISSCLNFLGPARALARQLYEAHSQGSWQETLLASMPHFAFGLLFALNWWHMTTWLLVLLIMIGGAIVYSWWQTRPTWFFTWLSYCLLTLLAAGLLLLYLPTGWSWVALDLYASLLCWVPYVVNAHTARKDWLFIILMLLPLPSTVGWFLAIEPVGDWTAHIEELAPWIAVNFMALGLAAAAFMRLRKRGLKTSVLIISIVATGMTSIYYAQGKVTLPSLLMMVVIVLNILLGPLILEKVIKHPQEVLRAKDNSR